MKRRWAGLDEAGRGPVIGPLVIAGVLADERKVRELASIGVKDSKLLTARTRTALAKKISNIAMNVVYADIQPAEIDTIVLEGRRLHRLNFLEATFMAKLISDLKPTTVWVDAADVKPERYARQIRDMLPPNLKRIKLISEHKADVNYPIVSAASIMAKVRRDTAISTLWKTYGNFGSGYPSDPRTIRFLRNWHRTHTDYPPIVRKSWKTIKNM